LRKATRFIVAVATPLLVGGLSGFATARGVQVWYPTLVKPSFNPPSWVFGPVWTVLYVMMGISAFLVWQKGWNHRAVRAALILFTIQLVLNGLWSVLFFGVQSPGLAFLEILILWAFIAGTTVQFWRVDPLAGTLLLPYAAWVSFAAVLNGAIWMLNR